jgi:hypothetical protein
MGSSLPALTTMLVENADDLVLLGKLLFLKLTATELFFGGQVRAGRQLVYFGFELCVPLIGTPQYDVVRCKGAYQFFVTCIHIFSCPVPLALFSCP